jgi:hypothetical protein
MHVEGDAMRVEGVAMHVEGDAMHVEGVAMHVEGDAMHVEGVALYVEGDAMGVEGDAMHVEVDAMRFIFDKTQIFSVFNNRPLAQVDQYDCRIHFEPQRHRVTEFSFFFPPAPTAGTVSVSQCLRG